MLSYSNTLGLVIVLGQYGSWKGESEEEAEEGSVIDVTVPLQYKVEDSQLILEEGPKSSLYGSAHCSSSCHNYSF